MIETNKFYEFRQPENFHDPQLHYKNNMENWDKKRFLTITPDDIVHPFTLKTAIGKVTVDFKRMPARSIHLAKILRKCFIKFEGVFPHIKCIAVNKISPWKEEYKLEIKTKI